MFRRWTWKDETHRVKRAAKKGNFNSIGHAAASIRRAAMRLIRRSKTKPSPPGQPPRTRAGLLRKAIVFDVDKRRERAIIGPRASVVGTAGAAHEHGGQYKGQRFPQRSFMGPALETSAPRLGRHWKGSIIGP